MIHSSLLPILSATLRFFRTAARSSGLALLVLASAVLPAPAALAQGAFVPDPAIPAIISPSRNTSQIYVLNRDLSILFYSTSGPSISCAPFPGFSLSPSIL